MQVKLKTLVYLGAIINLILYVVIAVCAYYKGYDKALQDVKAQINLDKKTLQNHAKDVKTIRSEPTDSVIIRLNKNLGTD
jgi:hypothetical protein